MLRNNIVTCCGLGVYGLGILCVRLASLPTRAGHRLVDMWACGKLIPTITQAISSSIHNAFSSVNYPFYTLSTAPTITATNKEN